MDMYDFAMQMEKDGEAFYRDLADKTGHKGLRNILGMLADEEMKHYHVFKKMKECAAVEVSDSPLLNNAKSIFAQMKEAREMPMSSHSELELYRKALDLEKKAVDFFLQKAGEESDASRKGAFLKLANEEKRHFGIIQNIVDFVSQPAQWLEDAEVYHLEDY